MAIFFIFLIIFIIFIFLKHTYVYVFRLKNHIIPITLFSILIGIILFSSSSLEVARNSFLLWSNNVLPSLLPFFICIEILKQTKFIKIVGNALNNIMYPLFNVPGAGAFALIMGIASGYPTRSKSS